jgi:D-alanyl-D-alanine carboxypeptidase/D-alanyl-D-alanine-endopeptidase (penicillin-binding protein 4)
LKELASQVAAVGIHRITNGNVIVDDRLFDAYRSGGGSGPSLISPISINDNLLDFRVTATSPGEPAKVEWRPQTRSLIVDAQVNTVSGGKASVNAWREDNGRYVVRGQIPEGSKPVLAIQEIDDPATFARALFIEQLNAAGVRVDASPLAGNNAAALPPTNDVHSLPKVASFSSPPFSEEIKLILKVSHNQHANLLPMLLALKNGDRDFEKGLKREGEILKDLLADTSSISFADGGGGARVDHVTPRATVELLRKMSTRPEFKDYKLALPILGREGSLASILTDSLAAGHVHAKTGTLYWNDPVNQRQILTAKGLAGYLTTHSGRELAFAIFVNRAPVDKALGPKRDGRALARLCEIVYQTQ